jgi:hypothetical protein
MTYYVTPFGNGVLVGSGGNVTSNVHNHFGPFDIIGTQGVNKVEGMSEELVMYLSGEMYNDVGGFLNDYILPAGSIIKDAYIDVEEAFALSGTDTLAVEIGTATSEATNGFTITEAQIEATNSVNLTGALSGTWDNEAVLAADTIVSVALTGTNPVLSDAGKARITIKFDRVNRSPAPAAP